MLGSICWNAAYMLASRCSPKNLPGSDLGLYFSSGSLMSRPLRPRMAIASAMAWRFCAPCSYLVRDNRAAKHFLDLPQRRLHMMQQAILFATNLEGEVVHL